jgi:hypothetical protein
LDVSQYIAFAHYPPRFDTSHDGGLMDNHGAGGLSCLQSVVCIVTIMLIDIRGIINEANVFKQTQDPE